MANLKTTYMGLELKNPVIVGACNLCTDTRNLKQMEEAGAGAIVYKSLFEEQIHLENLENYENRMEYAERNAEMITLFPEFENNGPKEYLYNLSKARNTISIPLIASLNAVYDETWVEYAGKIQETGVDGIELNFFAVPDKFDTEGRSIEEKQIQIVKEVKAAIQIPVSVKLSPFYSNPLKLIKDMELAGVNAFVLFNRLFQPDIDVNKEEHHFPYNVSCDHDNRLALRYAGLLFDNVKATVCANTGVFTGEDVVKMLLAGAGCVQVVSTLYKNQISYISQIIKDLEGWMDAKGYKTIDDFRGKLSRKNTSDKYAYRRAQYIDILMRSDEIFKKYPVV
jgi:dihydroorotate dehydrogenase (fumarate)